MRKAGRMASRKGSWRKASRGKRSLRLSISGRSFRERKKLEEVSVGVVIEEIRADVAGQAGRSFL
jgi:hypothetical protein